MGGVTAICLTPPNTSQLANDPSSGWKRIDFPNHDERNWRARLKCGEVNRCVHRVALPCFAWRWVDLRGAGHDAVCEVAVGRSNFVHQHKPGSNGAGEQFAPVGGY